jgi:uncharacterized protein
MFAITSFYTALLAIGAIVLANIVSARRGKTDISILHGEDMTLALWIRRHGNFMETVPLALLLMAFSEARGAPVNLLHGMGIVLILARLSHVFGMSVTNAKHPLRILGGVATQIVMLAGIGFLLWNFV